MSTEKGDDWTFDAGDIEENAANGNWIKAAKLAKRAKAGDKEAAKELAALEARNTPACL
jgi:hypothetical protein